MLYRKFGSTKENISILGFGCMRLPVIDGDNSRIDEDKAAKMLHTAIDNGVNYIDTAYPYHNGASEPFVGKALSGGYREKVHLATKLPSWLIKTREDMDKYLDEQLKRLQTDYIDFYLVHALNKDRWKNLTGAGIFEFLDSVVKDGRVRYVGFSYHDGPGLFKEIVDAYPWTFCQIQYNYLDEDYQAGKGGLLYAVKKGMAVVIMEPLRGGKIAANVPADIQNVWDKADIKRSPAEWGLRFLWDQPEVSLILSGMTEMDHVIGNIKASEDAYPNCLTEKEKSLIEEVKGIYKSRMRVNCTNCRYCMPCPGGVNIPESFNQFNNAHLFNDIKGARNHYNNFVREYERASKCLECGKCEEQCPQHIPIRDMLKEAVNTLEV